MARNSQIITTLIKYKPYICVLFISSHTYKVLFAAVIANYVKIQKLVIKNVKYMNIKQITGIFQWLYGNARFVLVCTKFWEVCL